MGSQRFLEALLAMMIIGFLLGSCNAYKFYVGGRNGWVLNPSENYSQWAHRNRFQVNDILFFKYKTGSESVLVVKQEDFDSCNTKSPIQSLTDGDSIFKLDHSGPFYFISGNADNCIKGQKLHIIVMAVRPKPSPTIPASPQSPSPLVAPLTSSPLLPPTSAAEQAPPSHSGAEGYKGLFGVVLYISIGVSVVLGSFVGTV